MSLIKFNRNRFPWVSDGISDWLDTDGFFTDDFFSKKTNLPAMNVKENKENFQLELAIPGFAKEDIEITMDKDMLSISGNNEQNLEEEEEGYTRKDFSYSSFERKISLPKEIDRDQTIEATYKDGVLKLELTKKAVSTEESKRKIAIN